MSIFLGRRLASAAFCWRRSSSRLHSGEQVVARYLLAWKGRPQTAQTVTMGAWKVGIPAARSSAFSRRFLVRSFSARAIRPQAAQ